MKDIIITAKRIKIELYTLLIAFVIANGVNLYAIIKFQTKFVEIITQIGYVLLFTLGIYVLWTIVRLIYWSIKRILKK
ncbi:MAG: hypothetical protein BGO29_03620 [Bacteroidales bacterium 36-12]|nr:MAG: hypothetical protein BGO29_03620 [Bacteroidales bacterium 36-12]